MAGRTGVRRRLGVLAVATVTLALGAGGLGGSALAQSDPSGLGDLPINPEWLANTLGHATAVGKVKNNPTEGAIANRDKAVAAWKAAEAAYEAGKGKQPDPLAKPEYNVVWSSKQNVADVNADVISKFVQASTVNPQGLGDLLNPQFLPGLDGFQVIDMRAKNLDGTDNIDYGKVVNFVQLPLPWGLENEAHHMQYEWHDGDPILAGGLFTGTTHVLDASDIPNLTLKNEIPITQTPGGSIADAYEKGANGRFYLTLMGGPLADFGGSPGEIVTFKPDKDKGMVVESESPAGGIGTALGLGKNPNGVPEPCSLREARPVGTCANPHGIEMRTDLGMGITSDYAEPREIVLDPLKTIDKYAFRPTIRSWDISGANAGKPKLVGAAHVPNGPLEPAQRAHEQYGIMEAAKTYPDAAKKYKDGLDSKGIFDGSMCGGGVFFTPDITKAKGDFSSQVKQVWNDGLSQVLSTEGKDVDEPGGCAGGAWHQVSPNNRILFRAVQGRNPGSDNYFDQGQAKMVYDIDISPLIKSAQDGTVDCDLSRGIHAGGLNLTGIQLFNKLAKGEKVADCPFLISVLPVKDITSGGPHWGAIDNHSIDQNGVPTRLTFSNYFVSRTGVDGDHRFYTVNVDPTGKLAYDENFRDEKNGSLGVNFNRRNWPGNPDAGFYKPHSEIWVCPPGICPDNTPVVQRAAVRSATVKTGAKCSGRRRFTITVDNLGQGQKVRSAVITQAGKRLKVTRARNGRLHAQVDLRKATRSVVKVVLKLTTTRGKTVTRTRTYHPCPAAATKKK
ncbi:MAG: hypothetical protein JWM31_1974 [Solirubrobacterales bacterium]|nr:hypothetical protein [Solirubrobacterales bacterium]